MIRDTTNLLSFSPTIPGLQIAWDSTSLGALKSCPRFYQYSILEGWTPRRESDHLRFGIIYHKAIEVYDHSRASGTVHDDALDAALDYSLNATVDRLPSGRWRPWSSVESNKNRETLIRTVVWYLDQFAEDAAETVILSNGKPAVELSFRFELDMELEGQPVVLCGHLDRIVNFGGKRWVMDHKTTKYSLDDRYFKGFNPDNQMTLYTIASQIVFDTDAHGVIIDGAQVLVTFSRFMRGFTHRKGEELEEWLEEAKLYISQAEGYARSAFWPKNDKFCSMYGGCAFRSICSASPKMRDSLLQAEFQRRTWDPLQVRGDV